MMGAMKSTVTEVAPDTYRISTFYPEKGIQVNQYLIKDDQPFLMHAGLRKTFRVVHDALSTVIDPSQLRWIGFSHFEPDECGAVNEWLAVAPHAQIIHGIIASIARRARLAMARWSRLAVIACDSCRHRMFPTAGTRGFSSMRRSSRFFARTCCSILATRRPWSSPTSSVPRARPFAPSSPARWRTTCPTRPIPTARFVGSRHSVREPSP